MKLSVVGAIPASSILLCQKAVWRHGRGHHCHALHRMNHREGKMPVLQVVKVDGDKLESQNIINNSLDSCWFLFYCSSFPACRSSYLMGKSVWRNHQSKQGTVVDHVNQSNGSVQDKEALTAWMDLQMLSSRKSCVHKSDSALPNYT